MLIWVEDSANRRLKRVACQPLSAPNFRAAAAAEATREEYKAITDSGINVQLDDPIIVNVYELQYSLSGDMAAFRKWAESHVELVKPCAG